MTDDSQHHLRTGTSAHLETGTSAHLCRRRQRHLESLLPGVVARAADVLLETSVVGSFTRIGPAVRMRLEHWTEPAPLTGQTAVVTGATSGLGLATAKGLAGLGATVCLIGRDRARLAGALAEVEAAGEGGALAERADLEDLDQVAALCDRLISRLERIDVLAHVAGSLVREPSTSPQGFETTLAVHLLAPFLLTERLLPVLSDGGGARIITMTSGGMYLERFDLRRLGAPGNHYSGAAAYARAKRAQVVLTGAWQDRYASMGLRCYTVHPGWADTPGLSAGLPVFSAAMRPLLRRPDEGADTLVWLASGAAGRKAPGRLWLDRRARSEHRVPWTWVTPGTRRHQQAALFEWCRLQVGDRLTPA